MSAALGLVVLGGWHTGVSRLVQVLPSLVPMQYNTALCFVFCGAGLLAVLLERRRLAFALGGIAAGIGLLTLFQYATGVDLFIDELLMEHAIMVQTSHPGRMAPNSALCFLLAGTALALAARDARRFGFAIGLLGGQIVLLGATALAGYLAGVESAYGWGRLTRMALHTSVGFMTFGVGVALVGLESLRLARFELDATGMRWGIGARVTLLVGIVVAVSIGGVTAWNYHRVSSLLISNELDRLARETREIGDFLASHVDVLRSDVRFLAGAPPIAGIVRAVRNEGIDPLDHSTAELSRERLAHLFEAMLRAKPEYTQMRLIAGDGMEIVRVNSDAGRIRRVPDRELQPKAHRPYIREAALLEPGEVYLSRVDLNREHGRIVEPRMPVLRAAASVRDAAGEPFGIVIINRDMRAEFDALREQVGSSGEPYVANGSGEILLHPDKSKGFAFEFGRSETLQHVFPGLAALQAASDDAGTTVTSVFEDAPRRAAAIHRVTLDPRDPGNRLAVAVAVPYQQIVASTSKVAVQTLVIGLLIGPCAVLLAHLTARSFTRPLYRITRAVKDFPEGDDHSELPVESSDESGLLARTFEKMARQVRDRTEALERSNLELRQFAYVASHDLQTPLRAIAGFAQFLRKDYHDQLDARADRYIDRVVEGCERMKQLINDLLTYSRVDSRSRPFRPTSLNELVDEVIESLDSSIRDCSAEVTHDDLPTVSGDRSQLTQLLQNLIGNSLKYHGDRRPRIHVSATADGPAWNVAVRDNGIGIDTRHHERIFEIFRRLHTQEEYPGTGIGLAVCRRIAQRHGGKIWLESELDAGSTFYFSISDGGGPA